jgi:ferric-dicitrate binding protein FerR (iron transport regulator)
MTTPRDDEIDWVLLDRYFTGGCTPVEASAVSAWLLAHPERRRDIEAARAAIDPSRTIDTTSGTDAAWSAVSARMRPVRAEHRDRPAMRPRVIWRAAAIAAGVVIAILGGVFASHLWRVAPVAVRELASAPGSRVTVTLRDGTTLVLGPATRLRVPSDFGVATRAVTLDGEALFTVVHDARHPFLVRTARTTVRDVGTTFAVRAYRDDAEERIAVADGEVMIGNAALHARDVATIDAAGHADVRRGVSVDGDLGWAQGRLVFDGAPVDAVVRELGRTFNLDVRLSDSALAHVPFSASFTDESADQVLEAMTCVIGARAERAGRVVIIRAGRRGEACR